jgi:hypothetical protein
MLAEIDKDARDIKVLQEENRRLKDELQELKKTVASLVQSRDVPIVLDAVTMDEIILEPFNEVLGRKLFVATFIKGKRYIAGSNLQVLKVYAYDPTFSGASDVSLPLYNPNDSSECYQPCRKVNFDDAIKAYFQQKLSVHKLCSSVGVHRDTYTRGMLLNYVVDFYSVERKQKDRIISFALYLVEAV